MKYLKFLVILSLGLLAYSCEKSDDTTDEPDDNTESGISPADILSDQKYSHVVLDIQYPANYQPPAGSVEELKSFISQYCKKPGGVEARLSEISYSSQSNYKLEDVRNIEDSHRQYFSEGDTLAVYVLLMDGEYSENGQSSSVLGIAYRSTSFVVFQKTVQDHTGGITEPSEELVTSTIFNHEMGHLMGLVNTGTPMVNGHEDGSHEHHCNDDGCLMYWAVQSADAIGNLLGTSNPPSLDSQCQADLKANGGK